jgi:uncharacterized membrane protein
VTTTHWLLGFHLVAAFLFVSGAVAVGVLHTAATRRKRPSEVASLLGLTRAGVAVVSIGAVVALILGAALVRHEGRSFATGWISAALALWLASVVLGGIGGRSARHARYLAERLASEDDRPSDELHRVLTSARAQALNYGSFAAALAILALMIWQPGG